MKSLGEEQEDFQTVKVIEEIPGFVDYFF